MCFMLLLASCSVTKYVPADKELLKQVKIKTDVPAVAPNELKSYLYQQPNNYFLGFWRMQLDFYNASGPDSTKWINRWLRRIGEPPVIYDPIKAEYSREEIQKVMFNKGYINAEVTLQEKSKHRQMTLLYNINGNEPYRLRHYLITLPDEEAQKIVARADSTSRPKRGDLFDVDHLNLERERVARILRNNGYYNFRKELLFFTADSALSSHMTDVEMSMQPHILESDSALNFLFTKKYIDKIKIITMKDSEATRQRSEIEWDTVYRNGMEIIYNPHKKTFRPGVLANKIFMEPGQTYAEWRVDYSYSRLGALNAIKYANIAFEENKDNGLDVTVTVTQDKPHSVFASIEGTYSDGDLGAQVEVGYKNNNIFHGSEILNVNATGGYEAIGSLGQFFSAWNVGGEVSLIFPQLLLATRDKKILRTSGTTEISVSVNHQERPEYRRLIANAGYKYSWRKRYINYTYNVLDISYIYLPWMSDAFKDRYMKPTSSIRFSYEDHFIMRMGFGLNYSNRKRNNTQTSYFTLRANVRTAGNLLYGLSHLFNQPKNEEGVYSIFNIQYSQYAKADIDYAYNLRLSDKSRLVFHTALGVGVPYGNATILPFEERYFTGGANSMRGWSARTLGPGNFHNSSGSIDFMKQSGDIKLDLNIEARFKIVWKLHGAVFVDAGNIWTIRNYPEQPEGQFRFDTFYKQIACNYGVGIRADFDFFVIRVDMGIKLYDPGFPDPSERWRISPTWKDDLAFHFAVGYPF